MGAEKRESMRIGTLDTMPQAKPQRQRMSGEAPQKSMLQSLKDSLTPQSKIQERALRDAQNFGKSTEI